MYEEEGGRVADQVSVSIASRIFEVTRAELESDLIDIALVPGGRDEVFVEVGDVVSQDFGCKCG